MPGLQQSLSDNEKFSERFIEIGTTPKEIQRIIEILESQDERVEQIMRAVDYFNDTIESDLIPLYKTLTIIKKGEQILLQKKGDTLLQIELPLRFRNKKLISKVSIKTNEKTYLITYLSTKLILKLFYANQNIDQQDTLTIAGKAVADPILLTTL